MAQLSDGKIMEEIINGNITIIPFEEDNLNPNSLDVRLGNSVAVFCKSAIHSVHVPGIGGDGVDELEFLPDRKSDILIDPKKSTVTYEFSFEDKVFLKKGHLYLFPIKEFIGCKADIGMSVEGKSSYARLGIDIHVCGGHIDNGFEGILVLEVRCMFDTVLYADMNICQLVFNRIEGKVNIPYGKNTKSKYNLQTGPQQSLAHLNFK